MGPAAVGTIAVAVVNTWYRRPVRSAGRFDQCWPADTRLARPLAMLNATTGRGLEAFQMLQTYLAVNDADSGALYLGVQWLYQIHSNGGVVRDRAEDLALARTYAANYARVNGPKQPLVNQRLDYLRKAELSEPTK